MDKQIEEMVITAYPIYATMEDELRKEAIECMHSYPIFERLYKAGYRKIPENAVVVSRAEYNDLKGLEKHFDDYLIKEIVETRKETAEKFALKLADYFVEHCGGKLFIGLTLQEWYKMIDEICKEITEGKNET